MTFQSVNKIAGVGLAFFPLSVNFQAKAQTKDDIDNPDYLPKLASMYPASEGKKYDFDLQKRPNINTIPGFLEQSLNYTDLEVRNFRFYEGISIRSDQNRDFASKSLKLMKNGLKRTLNETYMYEGFELWTDNAIDIITQNTTIPFFDYILGDTVGGKFNNWAFGSVAGLDFDLGGDPADIRTPITKNKNESYGVKFKPFRMQLQGWLGGGDGKLFFQLDPTKARLGIRDRPLDIPGIGIAYFSVSQTLRPTEFGILKGGLSYDQIRSTTDANLRLKVGETDMALGLNYSTNFGKQNADSAFTGYLAFNYDF